MVGIWLKIGASSILSLGTISSPVESIDFNSLKWRGNSGLGFQSPFKRCCCLGSESSHLHLTRDSSDVLIGGTYE